MRRIDTHMHFWTLAMERSYSLWMTPELKVLYGDYGPRDARPLMEANGVEGCVLVSAASSIEEMGYLLGLADGHDIIRGVVTHRILGWSKSKISQDVDFIFDLVWKGIAAP